MARTRKLDIEITDSRKGTGFKDAERDVDSFDKKLTSKSSSWASSLANFAKVAAVGLGVAGVAAAKFGLDAVHAFEESQQVTRQTDAVIKSIGASSWTTADAVAGLAEKLSLKTGIDDEVIQSGQNMLLTFANVRNEVGKGNDIFDRGTTAALNMSVAMGTDLNSANIQLGKALNDPIAGISALTRVGVQFTDQQKDQIKTLVESGDVLGAQKIILGEVEKQFDGSAEAQATASAKMSVAWGNLQEKVGEKLLPVFEAFSSWITATLIPTLEDLSDWIERELVPRLEDLGSWLGEHVLPAVQALASWITGTLVPALADFAHWLTEHQRVLAAVAIGITAMLVPAFVAWAISAGAAAVATLVAIAPLVLIGIAVAALAYLIITHWDTIKQVTITVFEAVKGAIETAFNWVRDNWPLLLGIITGPIGMAVYLITTHWQTIKDGATAVKDWIVDRFNDVVGFVTGLPGLLAAGAAGMWEWLKSGLVSVLNWVIDKINAALDGIDKALGPYINFASIPSIRSAAAKGAISYARAPRMMAEGGIVTTPTFAMIGEGGPEAVVPLDGRHNMGGTTIVNVNVAGSILTERQLVDTLNEAMARGARLNVNGRYL